MKYLKSKSFGIIVAIILLFTPSRILAETVSTSGTATEGSTFTLIVTVDLLKVKDETSYNVLVKLVADSFGPEIDEFVNIYLYAKLEGGAYLQEEQERVTNIDTEGESSAVVFTFNLTGLEADTFNVYGKADFSEKGAIYYMYYSFNTGWFNAHTVKVNFPNILYACLPLIIVVLISSYRKKNLRKKQERL
jgi:hypothetical protein